LWWSWTAPASGWTTIDTAGSKFDTRLGMFTGNSLGDLQLLVANDDEFSGPAQPAVNSSRVSFQAVAGTQYQIQVGAVNGGTGMGRLTLLGQDVPPPQLAGVDLLNGTPRLPLIGTPGQTVWIQVSEDLVNWFWVESMRFNQAQGYWSDPSSLAATFVRFYRLYSAQP
jgi:hypothetical protein